MKDHEYMQQALSLAQRANGFTSPNPCVGAVVVRKGTIVGKGFHRAAGLSHAEVEALDDAGPKALDATLYVTLEPCTKCSGAMLLARVGRIVFGASDPRAGAVASTGRLLEGNPYNHGVEIVGGILAEECSTLLKEFFQKKR